MRPFLDALEKLWKATISFVISALLPVCLSVSLSVHLPLRMEHFGPHWTDFHRILIFEYFSKICWENSSLNTIWPRITATLLEDRYTCLIKSRSFLLRMRNVWDGSCRQNRNTRYIFNNLFFRKTFLLWDNVEKFGTAEQATDESRTHAHCIPDT